MSVIQVPIPATTALAITIATRESRLALWQAEHVKTLLEQRGHTVNLLGMTTSGDQILDRSLSKVGGKGLFVKELELALDDGSADIAVHSLKDVPMDLPAGFVLACVMAREDPRDAFVSNHYANLAALPPGATVGTSSLRRVVLLKALRPDLNIAPLRGNLDTRLRKMDEGQFDAIILAAAGLKRLGLAQRIRAVFAPTEMLPAAGQGALGIEIKADRLDLLSALAPLAHQPTWLAVAAERAVSRAMGGSCSMPLAAHAVWQGLQLRLNAAWGEPDDATLPLDATSANSPAVTGLMTGLVTASLHHEVTDLAGAAAMGEQVAAALRSGGARVYTPTALG